MLRDNSVNYFLLFHQHYYLEYRLIQAGALVLLKTMFHHQVSRRKFRPQMLVMLTESDSYRCWNFCFTTRVYPCREARVTYYKTQPCFRFFRFKIHNELEGCNSTSCKFSHDTANAEMVKKYHDKRPNFLRAAEDKNKGRDSHCCCCVFVLLCAYPIFPFFNFFFIPYKKSQYYKVFS